MSVAPTGQTALSTFATKRGGVDIFTKSVQAVSIDTPLMNLLINSTGGQELPGAANTDLLTLLEANISNSTYGASTTVQQLAQLMQARLGEVLAEIMDDVVTFIKFAENGAFSTKNMVNSAALVAALVG